MSNFDFDQLLAKCGDFGKYQIVLYIIVGICGFPTGWQNLLMVFVGGQQDHWCAGQNSSAIPRSGNLYTRQCMYYDYSNGSTDVFNGAGRSDNQTDAQYVAFLQNDSSLLVKCDKWEFDTSGYTSTIRSQWNLVCDNEYLVALATTIYMSGFLTGAVTFGSISDIIGRKKTLMICIVLELLSSLAAAITSRYGHYVPFVILRFIAGNVVGGSWTVAFVIVMEIVGSKYRMYLGILFQCWFACGFLSISLFAYFVRDHFTIQLMVSLPVAALFSYYWLIPESPRWLYAENRSSEAEPVMRAIARRNNRPFPTELGEFHKEDYTADHHQERASLFDILRRSRMRLRLLCISFVWFVTSLVYYGLSLNADALGGSVYVNAAITSFMEIPACIVTCFVLDRFGRRWILVITEVVAGLALLGTIPALQNEALQPLVITLANVGKFASSASFAIVYVYTAELFPTVVRNVAVGSGSMCARIGGLLAPQIVRLDKIVWFALPSVIMGALSLAAGGLTLTCPETTGERLPETLDDGERFGTKEYKMAHNQEYMKVANGTHKSSTSNVREEMM